MGKHRLCFITFHSVVLASLVGHVRCTTAMGKQRHDWQRCSLLRPLASQVRMSHTRCRLELSLRGSSRASRLPCFECTCTLARDLHTHLRVYKRARHHVLPL